MKALIEVRNIECKYRHQTIVKDLSLHVNQGSLVCLLGPSGCGKTTILRAIAGFEPVYRGTIRINDQEVSRPGYTLVPEKRHLGMVFQDYALFPHMTVLENISFGLRNNSKREQQQLAREMLSIVGMNEYGERYPHELSGGQQQRIALARALAPRPKAILLDEPFSNLDVDMRKRLSTEVRNILKDRGITGIMVTHDQDEAFALGDHVGVMKDGCILQWDTPFNLYHEPANRFVADFIGQGVFIDGVMITPNEIRTEFGIVNADRAYKWPEKSAVEILLRPDDVVYDPEGPLKGKITQKAFKGAEIMYTLRLDTGTEILSLFPSHEDFMVGDKVNIRMDIQHVVAFTKT
ncbi:MAG: ABC transporter ATP-binding protein [Gammaproteobacteria bacterium]|nr:ABC transporter ATP-binding protein [Gammaproteobacteria bacterium]